MENTSTEAADVAAQIKRMLVEDLQLKLIPDAIPDDCSLLENGLGLDSISIAELIAQIEDRFGLQFDDQVLEIKLFDNLSVLAAFVAHERLAGKANGGAVQSEPGGLPWQA